MYLTFALFMMNEGMGVAKAVFFGARETVKRIHQTQDQLGYHVS